MLLIARSRRDTTVHNTTATRPTALARAEHGARNLAYAETMRPYDKPDYKKNRATLLRDNPPCTYCGRQATEADHIVPIHAGGDNSLDNLTPACKTCNSRRGQRTQAAADAHRIAARKEAMATVTPIAKALEPAIGSG